VVTALKATEESGWHGVAAADVSIKDCSGYGGCRTFKVTVPSLPDAEASSAEPSSTSVVLHSRLNDHAPSFMARLSMAHAIFAQHSLAAPRIAEGGDWFLGEWRGEQVPHEALNDLEYARRHGALFARVHSIDPAWFIPHREVLIEQAPHLAAVDPLASVWAYASRGHHCDNMCRLYSSGPFKCEEGRPDLLSMISDMNSSLAPKHPLTRRLVTCHGDLHCNNTLNLGGEQGLQCCDFEFTCAAGAFVDLGSAMGQFSWGHLQCGPEHRRAFMEAYCEGIGHPLQGEELDAVLLDAMIAGGFAHFHSVGLTAPFNIEGQSAEAVVVKLTTYGKIADEARADPALGKKIIEEGLAKVCKEHPIMAQMDREQLRQSVKYKELQALLEGGESTNHGAATSEITHLSPGMLRAEGELVTIRAAEDTSMVLQVRPGTNMLELAKLVEEKEQQQWRVVQHEKIQHVATGLYLDAPVEYVFHQRNVPWEVGGACHVRPQADGDNVERQLWVFDGDLIRHRLDGRVLDVNFWEVEQGRGVNLSVPRTTCNGCSWVVQRCSDGEVMRPVVALEAVQVEPEDDPCPEGDEAEKVIDWRRYELLVKEKGARLPTVFELKSSKTLREAEASMLVPVRYTGAEGGDATVRVSGDNPLPGMKGLEMPIVGGSAWARVEVVHGRPMVTVVKARISWSKQTAAMVTCLMINEAAGVEDTTVVAPKCTSPIADIPEGVQFYICPAASQKFALTVGHDEDKPNSVKLGKIDQGRWGDQQKWTLVDGDGFRNVGNGEYLDSDLSYAFLHDNSEIWNANHTDLITAGRRLDGRQKWVLGPEEFHGGKVLRHWMDGRGVDVHGWQIEKDGGNMGVENSVHGDCKGISYVLSLCDEPDTQVNETEQQQTLE